MKTALFTTLLVETSPQGLPLGAACIASAVKNDSRTKGNFSACLLDFSLEDKDVMEASARGGKEEIACLLAKKLISKKPDYLCFSIYVWNRLILCRVSQLVKKELPACICIAGGPEVTANPFSFSEFDFMIAGQGESAIADLLSALEEKKEPGKEVGRAFAIQGVYARESLSSGGNDSHDEENPSLPIIRACPLLPEKTASPYLDGTLDLTKYGGALWELARGCPFKCSYCYESKGEKKISYFPLERLEKEIELFAEKKISQVFVLDPTYNASKERAIKMLKIIEKKAPGIFFYFEARAEF
nr:radical SAM protein [Treponema sp.]